MEDAFDELDHKVVMYLEDENISDNESKAIIDILVEYKQLVRDGYIPAKHPQEAFKDVVDVHTHKKAKIRLSQKDEGKNTCMIPLLWQGYIT